MNGMLSLIPLLTGVILSAQTPEQRAWQTISAGLSDSNPAKRIAVVISM